MAPDVASIERLAEEPLAVDPGAIEDEFNRIWRDTAAEGYDSSSVRLRVLNLVAVGRGDEAVAAFDAAMEVLPQRHPCRGILALIDESTPRLASSIGARCWRSPAGGRHVCSEEVHLRAPAAQHQELASAVLALLVPDLVVAAWLIGVAPDDELAADVLDAADRVFLDSARLGDPPSALQAIAAVARKHEVEPTDFAWGRTAGWRELVAQFFDGDDGLAQLRRIDTVEITCATPRLTSEAMLVAGWLVSRLGLSLADLSCAPDRVEATLYERTRGVTLHVRAAPGGPPLPLQHVRITTPEATRSLELHAESGHLHVRERWADGEARRTVQATPEDDASVLNRSLDALGEPDVYAEARRAALALLGG